MRQKPTVRKGAAALTHCERPKRVSCGKLETKLQVRKDIPPEKDCQRQRSNQNQSDTTDDCPHEPPVTSAAALGFSRRNCRALTQQIQVAKVRFPPDIKRIA